MKRRDFVSSLVGAPLALSGALLAQAEEPDQNPDRAQIRRRRSQDPDADWEALVTWNGNDSRFYHRHGGRPHGDHSWLDNFSVTNQNFSVCDTDGKLTLARGAYQVTWSVDVIFRNPACRLPSASYPVLLSRVGGGAVNGSMVQTWQSQVFVCANRNGLIYRGRLSTDFDVTSQGIVNISIVAFNDKYTADRTDINVPEVVVHKMDVNRRLRELTDEELATVQPLAADI